MTNALSIPSHDNRKESISTWKDLLTFIRSEFGSKSESAQLLAFGQLGKMSRYESQAIWEHASAVNVEVEEGSNESFFHLSVEIVWADSGASEAVLAAKFAEELDALELSAALKSIIADAGARRMDYVINDSLTLTPA